MTPLAFSSRSHQMPEEWGEGFSSGLSVCMSVLKSFCVYLYVCLFSLITWRTTPSVSLSRSHQMPEEWGEGFLSGLSVCTSVLKSFCVSVCLLYVCLFVFTYYLADDTISIFEPIPPNAGRMGGRFLIRFVCLYLSLFVCLFVYLYVCLFSLITWLMTP